MNFLFACDTNYALPLTVCLTSLFENNKSEKITVFILFSFLTENQKNILINLANYYKQDLSLIKVSEFYFKDAPTLRWSKEAYYRLLIKELLPKEIDRIIYMDCDTIVNKNLRELYLLDLKEYYLSALKEKNSEGPRDRLGLNTDGNYFQTGVILFDLNKCRTILNYEIADILIKKVGNKLLVVDQDIINIIFDGKIKYLNPKYNNCEITNFYGNIFYRLLNKINQKDLNETSILHYSTGKPWNNLFSGSCEEIWNKYLLLSPYKDLYERKYGKLKYKLLRTGLMKVLFYEYIHITPFINEVGKKLFSDRLYSKLKMYYRRNIK